MKLNKRFEKSNEGIKFLSSGLYLSGSKGLRLSYKKWIYFDIAYFNVWLKDTENSVLSIDYEKYR